MPEELKIIFYPDPRLTRVSDPVERFDESLRDLANRMIELMREARGVGLAAPQVGKNLRMFVANPTGKPEDDRVYINPSLSEAEGEEAGEEGCLSLPGLNVDILRSKRMKIEAQDLDGKPFEQIESGYIARIWQHEFDHLNGVLLLDRMGPSALMAHRRLLRELEDKYREVHGELPKKRK